MKIASKLNSTTKNWIILLVAWSIHNLEEALFVKDWIISHKSSIPILSDIATDNVMRSFPTAFILVTIILVTIGFLAVWKKWDSRFFTIVLGIYFVNAVQHIAVSLILMTYTPGVLTASILNLPLAIYLINWQLKNESVKNFGWLKILFYGLVAYIISMIVIWRLAILITNIFC